MADLSFTRGGYARTARSVPRGSGGYEIHRADHWLLARHGFSVAPYQTTL